MTRPIREEQHTYNVFSTLSVHAESCQPCLPGTGEMLPTLSLSDEWMIALLCLHVVLSSTRMHFWYHTGPGNDSDALCSHVLAELKLKQTSALASLECSQTVL